ncbi:tRNA-i(6)A37 methylthiotransferase [hydrothermal vent metagenome]|uniref:tRNA-i(6)A37 methylthiotransferase n=1 Tax=hydrothermal vent metagenome TaxID=652676 RepID=A0A3B1C6X1_9ZZZZ
MITVPKKKLAVVTLGCQMNKHDSERIAGLLSGEYDLTQRREEADFLVINTCSVRDKAEQKFFSLLGRLRPLKEANKKLVIGVAGCVAQDQARAIIKRESMVDLVFGPRALENVPAMLERFGRTGEPQVDTSDTGIVDEFSMSRESKISGWVSIMEGCNNYCSYCIVPYTRGGERSRSPESIVKEIRSLADEGYREVILLGQNVNSYGNGLLKKDLTDFPELLEKVDKIDGIERIRFVTSHPKDLSAKLTEAMANLPKVAPALHLPMQSGSDKILKRMNRMYTISHYYEKVEMLRKKVADIALTTDLIVGFPGETDKDFEATFNAVKNIEFENIFLFKYSPRRGTTAAKFSDQVSGFTTSERFERITQLQKEITDKKYGKWVGEEVEILVEGRSKKERARYTGRTPQNLIVHFQSDIDYTGEIINIRIDRAGKYSLDGQMENPISRG